MVCRIFGTHDKAGVQEIAAAYEAKYGRPLRQDVKAECSGNYRRLALAWLCLPDALEQPAAPVKLPPPSPPKEAAAEDDVDPAEAVAPPTKKELAAAAARAKAAGDGGDEGDDEEEHGVPALNTEQGRALYRRKIASWQLHHKEATAQGKKQKAEHYKQLLAQAGVAL